MNTSSEYPSATRARWIALAEKLARPVLENLAARTLRKNMPVEAQVPADRAPFTHLEALGRLLSGIAPWLETDSPEKWRALAREAIDAGTDPASPDCMNFTDRPYNQPLVDASYLAMALLRAPGVLWDALDARVKRNVITALKGTRKITANQSNWLLFPAVIEAFLHRAGEDVFRPRVGEALEKHMAWYAGDGTYGDGAEFHWDYYNGYVIQPMMLEVAEVFADDGEWGALRLRILARAQRYAAVQERLISPDGVYPPLGRSLVYRFGAFQPLAQLALRKQLPASLAAAQVRCALDAVIRRQMSAPGTFDENGWLRIGFCGHQPSLADHYISTGSLYICANGLLPLGLAPDDEFWTAPNAPWTSVMAWNGRDIAGDHAYFE